MNFADRFTIPGAPAKPSARETLIHMCALGYAWRELKAGATFLDWERAEPRAAALVDAAIASYAHAFPDELREDIVESLLTQSGELVVAWLAKAVGS